MNTINEQLPVNITIDLNKMFDAYNKADFMQKVFVEAITKNPQLFTESLSKYILIEFMLTEIGIKTKENIRQAMLEKTSADALAKERDFERCLRDILREEVLAQRGLVSQMVRETIQAPGFKQKTAECIAHAVRERVSAALGEVCEGCKMDMY